MTRREALTLAAVAAAAAAAGGLVGAFGLQASGAAELLSTPFRDLRGEARRLRDWQGRVVVCNFWATWCAPCREEVPILRAAQQQWAGQGIEVVGIGIDSVANIREFAAIFAVNYPILLGDPATIGLMRKLGNSAGGLPYNIVLDRQGAIARRKLGAFSAPELRQAVDGLVR